MAQSTSNFFFYDLETSGRNPRTGRIMQFAGQRTDMELKPVGEPVNLLIKMADDVLPEPEAVLIHGTTPQKTIADGISEAEFVKFFFDEICKPNTIFVGFNSIRFDDEFMRFLFYRNFSDAYEWQWKAGCGRWDLLDVTRLARALRPNGIKWPFNSEGKPSNSLELLTSINKLDHKDAHDALSDVNATIAVAKLIRAKQPKLFDYLLSMRSKKAVQELVDGQEMFVYASGKYPTEHEKTTVVAVVGAHPDKQGVLVYDLRADPAPYQAMSPTQLVEAWKYDKEKKKVELPIKTLQFNRCPAVAPVSVLDDDTKKRLKLNMEEIKKHRQALISDPKFYGRLLEALKILNSERQQQSSMVEDKTTVDEKLYDGFLPDHDRRIFPSIRSAQPDSLMSYENKLLDKRLKQILFLYKARNWRKHLSADERQKWESYRKDRLLAGGDKSKLAQFGKKLEEMAKLDLPPEKQYLLEELHLYGLGIRPED